MRLTLIITKLLSLKRLRYVYLHMRDIISALIVLIFVGLGSWAARSFGLYNSLWYADVILHLISGIGFAFVWSAFAGRAVKGRVVFIIGAASFAVLGSVAWEIWEFYGWKLTPSHARFYVPELGDSLQDVFCGFVGGVSAAFLSLRRFRL